MKRIYIHIFIFLMMLLGSCKAQHSYRSVDGKKKLKYYNSLQYDKQPKRK